jgi:S-adenosylmethionine decarboxylase
MNEITLFGFNHLTKSLSFSLYKLHYIGQQTDQYKHYIKSHYNADKLNSLLTDICHIIGGNVLNIAKQDYQPQGASVTLMISEELATQALSSQVITNLVAHLDKSHLCIHTYPDEAPQQGIAIFRADIELSTCGVISPLKVLNQVINAFDADVIDIDYRIRGMTRDKQGKKLFNIDKLTNISDFLSNEVTQNYHVQQSNFSQQNLFHAKLGRKSVMLKDFILQDNIENLGDEEHNKIINNLTEEIQQLFCNINQ